MKRRILALLAAGLLATASAWGQAPAAADCPPPLAPLDAAAGQLGMRDARDHGLLWRISQGGRSSWLYGTIHVAQLAWMFPGPALQQALRETDQVAVELDLMDPDIGRRLQAAISAKPGDPPLPPDLARRLARQSAVACVGDSLAALKPEMQAMTLVAMVGRRQGLEPAYGVDLFLSVLAHGMGKPVLSLETPEQQLALLLHDDPAEAAQQVTQILDEIEQGRAAKQVQRLAQDWANGALDDLTQYAQWCDCLNTAEERAFHRRLIDDRNLTLAERVRSLHSGGQRLLVAVGALHMIGPQGLPALLQAQGFRVEAVWPKP
jgi:hypothetical protein